MANGNYYLGQNPDDLLGGQPRFFYALRRTDEGEIYFLRVDNLKDDEAIDLNNPGLPEDNYNDFEVGVDFYEGRDINHNLTFLNLKYEQYRWDDRSMFYYIDDDGQLTVRINKGYTYPTGI